MDINDSIEKLELESLSNRYLQQLHENAACSAAVLYTACNFSNVQTSADFWDVVKIRKPNPKRISNHKTFAKNVNFELVEFLIWEKN